MFKEGGLFKEKLGLFLGFLGFAFIFNLNSACATELSIEEFSQEQKIYTKQVDVMALSFKIKSDNEDLLNDLVIANSGTSRCRNFDAFKLYADDGNGKFEGALNDVFIADGVCNNDNDVIYFENLKYPITAGERNFYVTVDIDRSASNSGKTVNLWIPEYYKKDKSTVFNVFEDRGLFLSSGVELPQKAVLNRYSLRISDSKDYVAPDFYIKNLSNDQNIIVGDYEIKGLARGQREFSVKEIEICVNNNCYPVSVYGDSLINWSYNWNESNIGSYDIYFVVKDYSGYESKTSSIHVNRIFDVVPDISDPEPAVEPISYVDNEEKDIRNFEKERLALGVFGAFVGKMPGNSFEWKIIRDLAYGVDLPQIRDVKKENEALGAFGEKYGKMPKNGEDWNIIRVLAYYLNIF